MKARHATPVAALLVTLSACGGSGQASDLRSTDDTRPSTSAAASSSAPSTPTVTYLESDACREQAQPVVTAAQLAVRDQDVRDFAGRLDTIDGLMPESVALCTSAVVRPLNAGLDSLSKAFDKAMDGGDIGALLISAYQSLETANAALQAQR